MKTAEQCINTFTSYNNTSLYRNTVNIIPEKEPLHVNKLKYPMLENKL